MIKGILALIGFVEIVAFATSSDGSVDLDIPRTVDDLQESYNQFSETTEHLGVIYDELQEVYEIWKSQNNATGDM